MGGVIGFRGILVLGGLVAVAALTGCQEPRRTRLELAVVGPDGQANHHYADFREAAYRAAPGGALELVLRTERPSTIDPTQTITQVLYVKGLWRPMPGTTYVEASQINARVIYAVLTPPTGVRYDGGAFVSYRIDKQTGELIGRIESGSLAARYRMGNAVEPFAAARITGTFRATEKPRDVVSTLQMLEARFSRPIEPAAADASTPG